MKLLRKQTLFYADSLNILRRIYLPNDYTYRDDFKGELLMYRKREHLLSVEIKSEKEVENVSTTSGGAFKELRSIINSLQCLSKHGHGRHKGWLAMLAQCWDYMQNGLPPDLVRDSFTTTEDVLVLPYDKKSQLHEALQEIKISANISIPLNTIHDYPSDNISLLIYKHDQLDCFFEKLKKYHSEQNDGADT